MQDYFRPFLCRGALYSIAAVCSLAGTAAPAESSASARYGDYFEVTASGGMLIGGEGKTGDSMRYQGKHIWSGPGSATVLVREQNNTGLVTGTVRAKGHTYTVLMNRFTGDKPFQSGGIAKFVTLHGLTKQGPPILPKTFAYLAGWGSPCTVWKDGNILYENFECHFMLTEGVRDPVTGEVHGFPDKNEIRELMRGEKWQGDYARNQEIKRRVREASDVSRAGLQLHLFAHSRERNDRNLPPYETAMHFLWKDVQWWSSPQTAGEAGPRRTDENIKRTIEETFKANAMVPAHDITVDVRQGQVTLTGTAKSAAEKNHAYFAAWTPGVTAVRNEIRVQGDDKPGDRDVQQAITRAYGLDPRVAPSRPTVKVTDGVVTLTGTVADQQAKQAAEDVARQFDGVKQVKNRLAIDESLAKGDPDDLDAILVFDVDPIEPGISKADRELQQSIESELSWSPYVDADRVAVAVRNRTAYLFGTVEDREEMEAAVDNAFEAGAERVVNALTIEPSQKDREQVG